MSSECTADANPLLAAAKKVTQQFNVDLANLPEMMDMTTETMTENVNAVNANCQDERMKFIFKSLVTHMHDFVRETSLTTEEWMTAIHFLTETGQKCTDIRQEFILLSDTLGVSALVDSMNNVKPPNATENTVLGPYHTEDAHTLVNGDSIASEGKGYYMYVHGIVLDTKGNPVAGAALDTWETDGDGQYDTQNPNRVEPDCRGIIKSAEDGSYAFRAVVPSPYPIPGDGPVGKLIKNLNRHIVRPAHLHFMIDAPGYEKLITALYFKGDPYITSDTVFGVRSSLIVDLNIVPDTSVTLERGFAEARPHAEVKYDFVLATVEECAELRKSLKANSA
ncbi:intradiol ring-cleavage dioxygenase [Mucidula mucida]|nr:intradiol ring-cleavage dioxygenase [Mucidula mucida]